MTTSLVAFILAAILSFLVASSVRAADPTPVGYWPFDEGAGATGSDASGNGHTATLEGGTAWVDGKIGKAIGLDGINDFVSIPDGPGLDGMPELTIEAWIYLHSYPTLCCGNIFAKWGPAGPSDDSYVFTVTLTGRV